MLADLNIILIREETLDGRLVSTQGTKWSWNNYTHNRVLKISTVDQVLHLLATNE